MQSLAVCEDGRNEGVEEGKIQRPEPERHGGKAQRALSTLRADLSWQYAGGRLQNTPFFRALTFLAQRSQHDNATVKCLELFLAGTT